MLCLLERGGWVEGVSNGERQRMCNAEIFQSSYPSQGLLMGQSGGHLVGIWGYDTALSVVLTAVLTLGLTTVCNHRQKHIGAADGLLPLPTPLSSG